MRGPSHVTYFSNFGAPLYLWNGWRYKPQILHADARDTISEKWKLGQKGAWPWPLVTWPKFEILGPPNISDTAEDTTLKFCTWIEGKGPDTTQKIQKWSKRGVLHLGPVTFLNKQATEAVRNGKIRKSTASNRVTNVELVC